MKIRAIFFAALAGLIASSGAGAQNPTVGDPPAGGSVSRSNEMIGESDSITIVALNSEEISKTWRVSTSGDLDLPMLGKVHAAGLTAAQLEQTLTTGLRRYIRDPEVTVYISDYRSQPITVAGAVHKPGTYQLEGSKTLMAGIMLASGPDAAGPTLIISRSPEYGPLPLPGAHTDTSGGRSSVELKLKDVLDPTTDASNLELRPGDVISLSMKQKMVYIIGEVGRPGAIELVTQDSVSVMQILAAAGGLTKLSAPRNSQVMRADSQGLYKKAYSIDLKKVMTGKEEDRLLSSGDIVVVPSSTLKTYGQAASMGAITTGLVILTRY